MEKFALVKLRFSTRYVQSDVVVAVVVDVDDGVGISCYRRRCL